MTEARAEYKRKQTTWREWKRAEATVRTGSHRSRYKYPLARQAFWAKRGHPGFTMPSEEALAREYASTPRASWKMKLLIFFALFGWAPALIGLGIAGPLFFAGGLAAIGLGLLILVVSEFRSRRPAHPMSHDSAGDTFGEGG